MKICIVSTDYPSSGRQSYIFVEQLANQMLTQGVEVVVVAPQSLTHALIHKKALRPTKNKVTSPDGIVYKVYRPYHISVGNNYPKVTRCLNYFKSASIESIVKKEKPDVLYAHFWENAEIIDGIARKYNLPLFVACGEGDNALEMMIERMSDERKKKLVNTVTGMISVSTENKRKCLKYGLCCEDNVLVLPNCVNTEIFRHDPSIAIKNLLGIKEEDFTIVFCGDFEARKGANRLSEAITRLHDSSIKSIFIGHVVPGDESEPTCDGIVYKGPVEHDELPYYLNSADIFVLPTRKEGCCNAIVEALACGLPVISSNGAFNDDILNEFNSIRINPNNVEAIADAIKELKNNRTKLNSMSAYSKQRVDEYSLENRATRIINFIKSKIQEPNEAQDFKNS